MLQGKPEYKVNGASLNNLEHNILSLLTNFPTPLYSIYADMMRDFENINLDKILHALVRLVELSLSKCYLVENGRKPIEKLTIDDLRQRCVGLAEEELRKYPLYTGEYEFEITEKGREEEAKDIYNVYYS